MTPTDSTPLADVRAYVRERADEGVECPACIQHARVYKRAMTATTARAMVALYRWQMPFFAHMPTLLQRDMPDVAHQGGYATLAQHWGLIESETTVRPDGGRTGYWRLTPRGLWFVNRNLEVPKYARLYAGRCLGLTGPPVTIADALGSRFDLDALMSGAA